MDATSASVNNKSPREAELEKQIAKLEQDLKDLGIELQATADEFELANQRVQQAKDEAERANQVKTAFLASMSHELRTPLNAIINLTKFVIDGVLGPINNSQSETLKEVYDSGKHLLNLINDVLDMSKIESGSLNLFVEDNVDIKAILDTVKSTAKGLLVDRPVDLKIEIAENLPSVRGDRQRILQILLNVMSNACKFTQKGSITLKALQKDGDIVISVQDSGPGIAAEDHALVFEAFKQTNTGLRHGGGTGLGMPISKNLAESHGGKIWLESEKDKGSTFFVSIPVKSDKLIPIASTKETAK
jgi:signal transduction histidine kinase